MLPLLTRLAALCAAAPLGENIVVVPSGLYRAMQRSLDDLRHAGPGELAATVFEDPGVRAWLKLREVE